jgi:hypothetical protein
VGPLPDADRWRLSSLATVGDLAFSEIAALLLRGARRIRPGLLGGCLPCDGGPPPGAAFGIIRRSGL